MTSIKPAMTAADRRHEPERCGAGDDERSEDLLGRVSDGRQRVGREDREAGGPRVALVVSLVRGNRLAHEQVLEGTDRESRRHADYPRPPFRANPARHVLATPPDCQSRPC